MNSQNNREAQLAALGFLIPAILSLIISSISSEKEVTPVTYWLAMIFVALVTVGALVEWARRSTEKTQETALPPTSGPPPPHQEPPPPRRTTRSILAGAVSGLVVSLLFFLLIGPGGHVITTAPHPSATVTVTPASTPPASTPAPIAPSTDSSGHLVTVRATPGDGGTRFGDDVTVIVTIGQPPPPDDTYWLIVQFLGGSNEVYKAASKVPATLGTSDYSFSIANSAVGSTRKIYVLQADSQAGAVLAQNYAHQEPSWDGNRTSLPSGVIAVSNSVTVTKQVG